MSLDRRSFLAAVMGAIAVRTLPANTAKPAESPLGEWKFGDWGAYDVRHYNVWDSVVVHPGESLTERLLPPPVPDDFLVTHIGVDFPGESPYRSLSKVCRHVFFSLRDGDRRIIEAPLFVLPSHWSFQGPLAGTFQLPLAYRHLPGEDFGIYLNSLGPVPSEDPITVTIMLGGLVPAFRAGKR